MPNYNSGVFDGGVYNVGYTGNDTLAKIQAARKDIIVQQGYSFSKQLDINVPVGLTFNMTNYSITGLYRYPGDLIVKRFTITSIDTVENIFQLSLSAAETALLTQQRYDYNVSVFDGVNNIIILEGTMRVQHN